MRTNFNGRSNLPLLIGIGFTYLPKLSEEQSVPKSPYAPLPLSDNAYLIKYALSGATALMGTWGLTAFN